MPFPSLLPSALYHEDSSCAAYAFQCSQPNTQPCKIVSCRKLSLCFLTIWNRSQAATYPPPLGACALFMPFRVSGCPGRAASCRNPSRRFLPSWNCIRARSSSAATNRVCCFRRQRAVHKAFACPKSRFLSKTSPSLF